MIIAFVILAAFTYTSGLRAPAMIAVVKDTLIYITVLALVIVVPYQLGGYAKLFAAIPALLAYNHFVQRMRQARGEMEDFTLEFLNLTERNFM